MYNRHDSLKMAFRLIMGNRKPSVLFSTGVLIMTAFFCSVTFLIVQMQYASDAKLKELYGIWQAVEFDSQTAAESYWQLHRKALILSEDEQVIGAAGTVPTDFLEANNLSLIEGRLPQKENEIAVTLSVLDVLGKTYDVNQEAELTWKASEDSLQTYRNSFIITGILPSYESYWFTGGNLLIDVICSDTCTLFTDDRPQTFLYGLTEEQLRQYRNSDSETQIVNEYAYPEHMDTDYGLYGIQAVFSIVCVLLIFFLNHLYGKSVRNAVRTLILIGAPQNKIKRLLNTLVFVCADIHAAAGLLICFIAFKYFYKPDLSINMPVIGAVIAAFVLLHFILYRQLKSVSTGDSALQTVQRSRRFSVASSLETREILLILMIFLSASIAITAADWQMLKYNVNKPYTAMNIQSDNGMSEGIMAKLSAVPYITETEDYYFDMTAYRISSEETKTDPVLRAVMNQPGFLMSYENGVAGMQMMVIPDQGIDTLWRTYDLVPELQNSFKTGEGVLLYLPGYVKKEDGTYDFSYTDTQVTSLEAGHKVSVDDIQTVILDTIRWIQPESLMTNNTILMPGTLIVSKSFYQKLKPEYCGEITRVSLRLEDNTPESVRRSISAIAVESGGRLSGDTYAAVSQVYQQSVFSAQLIILAGALVIAVSLLLLIHAENMKTETERVRIGILRGLGISEKKLRKAYMKRDLGMTSVAAAGSIAVHYGIVSYMNHGAAKLKIFEMLKCNVLVDVKWDYAWVPVIVTAVLMTCAVLILKRMAYAVWLSKEPYENLEG